MKKGSLAKKLPKGPKFRVMQDRFLDDPSFMHEGEILNDNSSHRSKQKISN